MKSILGLILALVAASASAVELTIDLRQVVDGWRQGQRVVLYSRSDGPGGEVTAVPGFGGFRTLRPDATGRVVVDIPASTATTHYALTVGGNTIEFQMPARAATLQELLANRTEAGPCIVSATQPGTDSPAGSLWCEPSGAQLAYLAGSVWHPVQGGDGGGGGITLSQARAQIKDFAQTGGRDIALGDLLETDRNKIEDAIVSLTFDETARELTITTNEPTTSTLTIPGGGAPYDDAPLSARVAAAETELDAVEARVQWTRNIGTYAFTSGGAADQYFPTGLTLPLTGYGRTVRVTVDSETPDEFLLQSLLDKTRVTTVSQAAPSTGEQFQTDAGETITIAINNAGGVWVADSDLGTRHSFLFEVVEADLADPARARSTEAWSTVKAPGRDTNLSHTVTASQVVILSSSGTPTTISGASGSAAGLMTSTNQAKLDRYPNGCPSNQRLSGGGTGSAFTCAPDAVGAGGGIDTAAATALILPPARTGNTSPWGKPKLPSDIVYDSAHIDSVFGAFRGTDTSTNSTTIEVGGSFTGVPSLSTLRSITESAWVSAQEVGPRLTFVYIAIRVPTGQDAAVAAGQRALDVTESQGVFERYPSGGWTRIGTNVQGTFSYYVQQVADLPSGAMFLVRQQHELELAPELIAIDQWRRTLGLAGEHFAEQYPGVSPTRTDADQLVGTATALSPAADLDVAPYQHGEFHVSLELKITQSHTSVSFTPNEASPDDEDRQFTGSITVFASDLAEEPAFTTSNLEGLTLFNVPLYAAATVQGRYYLLLVHDSDNGIALYRHWVGEAGSSPLQMSAEARVSFTPTDLATLGTLGGLTETEVDARVVAGTLPQARAGNTTPWSATKAPGTYSTPAAVKTAYESNSSTNAYTNTDRVKVGRLPSAACSSGQILKSTGAAFTCQADATGGGNGGGGVSFSDKAVALGTNTKTVTANSSRVVLSDWSALTLTTDATASGGVTVAGNRIVFANAGYVWIEGSFEITTTTRGGGSRSYNDFRGSLVRSSTTTTPVRLRSPTCYTKTAEAGADVSAGAGVQGPPQQQCEFTWMTQVQAGDEIGVEWRAYLQTNPTATIVAANSEIYVRIAQ